MAKGLTIPSIGTRGTSSSPGKKGCPMPKMPKQPKVVTNPKKM